MKILVVGDTILDIYKKGTVERVNPEAPCLILDESFTEEMLGGAANVAANIRSLSKDSDLKIDYFGFASSKIVKMLGAFSVDFAGISCSEDAILTKTRFISDNHHLLRLDKNKFYSRDLCLVAEKMIKSLDLAEYDLIVISDYDKGTIEFIKQYIFDNSIKKISDIKKNRLYSWYDLKDSIFKCNLAESRIGNIPELCNLIDSARWKHKAPAGFIITKGKEGFSSKKNSFDWKIDHDWNHVPSVKLEKNVIDVVGAGDSFLAGMAVSYLETKEFDVEQMGRFGNACAGAKVCSFGTRAVKRSEVDEILRDK